MAKAMLVAIDSAWVRTLVLVVRNPDKPHIGVLKKMAFEKELKILLIFSHFALAC
jgi:hypothetical protein